MVIMNDAICAEQKFTKFFLRLIKSGSDFKSKLSRMSGLSVEQNNS